MQPSNISNKSQSSAPPPPQPFMRGSDYNDTYLEKVRPYEPIRKKFRAFMELKRNNPLAQFGASDKPFLSSGKFGGMVPGIKHAHITGDLSIVYKVENGVVYLYGFYTHDELGTGQPASIKKQDSMAGKFSRMSFKE